MPGRAPQGRAVVRVAGEGFAPAGCGPPGRHASPPTVSFRPLLGGFTRAWSVRDWRVASFVGSPPAIVLAKPLDKA
eukprot:scaffold21013_cov63-Phaeocystis_antarctica.AAC.4